MKKVNKFVIKFLEVIFDVIRLTPDILRRESMHYKDLRVGGFDPDKIYKGIHNLDRRGILNFKDGKFRFTKKGETWLASQKLRILSSVNGKWDKKWRVVIFDIPKEMNNQRNILRSKLKSLDFTMIQNSVFVIPFPCEEEIGYLCSHLRISDYVDIIVADSIGSREEELLKYYRL